MARKFMSWLMAIAVIGGAAALFAQEAAKSTKPAEGTLMVQDKNYPLTHALAYETTIGACGASPRGYSEMPWRDQLALERGLITRLPE